MGSAKTFMLAAVVLHCYDAWMLDSPGCLLGGRDRYFSAYRMCRHTRCLQLNNDGDGLQSA